uniref:VWFA domain-containing protein n=1 Tax=Cyprinus carpio TaxID=7962 RepID=A0A8C2BAW9_CYPCA
LASSSALVLCMDVGFSMSNSEPGQEPPFEQAKKSHSEVCPEVFAENKDEVGVVLFGTDDTKNCLAKDGQYENITVLRHLMMPDFELLEDIESKLQPGGQQADCILPVILVSAMDTSEDQLDIITENLKKAGITLQFFLPFPVDGEDRADGPGASARPGKCLSRQQTRGLEMVKHITTSLKEEDGLEEIYTFNDALEKLSIFKRIDRRPMAWPCQLMFSAVIFKRETVYCLNDDDETEVQKEDTIQGCLHHRGVNPDDPLPPVEPWLKRVIERPQDVSARCQAPLQDIKTKLPLKVVVKRKEQRTSADVFGSSADEPDVKKVKVDEKTEFNLVEITEGNITSVLYMFRDLCVLVRQKTVSFDQACQQLTHRIAQLLGNRSPEYYMKSVACIQAFRDQSVSVSSQLNLRIQSGICCGLLVMFLSAVWTLILTAPIHFVIPIIPNGDFQLNRFTLHLYLFFFFQNH